MLFNSHKSSSRKFDGLSFQICHHFDKLNKSLKNLQGIIFYQEFENLLEIDLKQEPIEFLLAHSALILEKLNDAVQKANITSMTLETSEYLQEIMEISIYFQKITAGLVKFDFNKNL